MISILRNSSRGYAMATFVLAMAIISTLTLVVVSTSIAEHKASRRLLTSSESRSMAASALDAFYAQVLSDASGRILERTGAGPTSSYRSPLVDPDAPVGQEQLWVTLKDGRVVSEPCDMGDASGFDRTAVCYSLALKDQSVGGTSAAQRSLNTVVVEVTTRTRCDEFLLSGAATACEYTRYQQRLRKKQFFDFIFYTKFSALDPERYADLVPSTGPNGNAAEPAQLNADRRLGVERARRVCGERYATRTNDDRAVELERLLGDTDESAMSRMEAEAVETGFQCIEVAYHGSGSDQERDQVNGPLYTNDDRILVCGDPAFNGTLFVSGKGAPGDPSQKPYASSPDVGCEPDEATPPFKLEQPDIDLPTLRGALAEVQAIPGVRTLNGDRTGGDALVLEARSESTYLDGVRVDAHDDVAGVLLVDGDVEIEGTVGGRLSVFATGKLTITGDLTYENGNLPTEGNPSDVLALNAQDAIVIEQPTGAETTRRVSAVLVSLGNAVYVDGWAQDQRRTTAGPTLEFYGAMAAKYQGIFGGYDTSTGDLVSGYHKDFDYDDRLSRNLVTVPYLFSPKVPQWVRTDVSEVAPCTGTVEQCT